MTQQLQTASLNGSSGGNYLCRAQHKTPNIFNQLFYRLFIIYDYYFIAVMISKALFTTYKKA